MGRIIRYAVEMGPGVQVIQKLMEGGRGEFTDTQAGK
jgi:hypothetical protein